VNSAFMVGADNFKAVSDNIIIPW